MDDRTAHPDGPLEEIQDAVQRSLLTHKSYDRAVVLALRWDNDDQNLGSLETELLNVFSQKFYYDIDSFIIPFTPTIDTQYKLTDLIKKYDTPRTLVVIFYGHLAWNCSFVQILYIVFNSVPGNLTAGIEVDPLGCENATWYLPLTFFFQIHRFQSRPSQPDSGLRGGPAEVLSLLT
ncbi:uncharacterized protein KD926_004786 [Aspergillus affinis]|uniref:uncharacterized protein n=1 Tax=Aspergillus affinis TaxID=1070780 RepID=UPI0022FDB8F5|nr:uncharacterized protein KD926_004786 [Aspergillus affinis]KAI9042995.1 hypothetical protein KD926_004786 [Aspergillus affinis]